MKNYSKFADELGELKAQLAPLLKLEKELKAKLIASGQDAIDGTKYRVTVSHVEIKKVAWQKVAEKLEPSYQLIGAYTKVSEQDRVNCKALIG